MLILSCGVIAPPVVNQQNTLLTGGASGLFGINRILPDLSFQKQDAILVIEYRGAASTQLTPSAIAGGAGTLPGAAAIGPAGTALPGGALSGATVPGTGLPGTGLPGAGLPGGTPGAIVPGVAGGNSLRGRY
jgi:hypothetical protein